ncbi:MAG: hypothetical protein HOP11_14415 [Saprospiraceae bacterium]|nr:hypothetical protein [Saprospiraceae bacterium]
MPATAPAFKISWTSPSIQGEPNAVYPEREAIREKSPINHIGYYKGYCTIPSSGEHKELTFIVALDNDYRPMLGNNDVATPCPPLCDGIGGGGLPSIVPI